MIHAFDGEKGRIVVTSNVYDEQVEISVKDNGKGIANKNMKQIYDPFFTTARGKGGSGLGLNIVYNIVNTLYNGEIECKSKEGKGTQFIIRIPIKDMQNPVFEEF